MDLIAPIFALCALLLAAFEAGRGVQAKQDLDKLKEEVERLREEAPGE